MSIGTYVRWLRRHRDALTDCPARATRCRRRQAHARREDERYRQRQGEVSALIEHSTITRLEREIEDLNLRAAQGVLFHEAGHLASIEQSIEEKREEIKRRREHYVEIREQLQHERARIIEYLLPKRFAMAGEARVFPVTVEIRLPERPR